MKRYIVNTSHKHAERIRTTSQACNTVEAASDANDWPESNWWRSIKRLNDPEVDDLLADVESKVLSEEGLVQDELAGEMILLDEKGNYQVYSMDLDDYIDHELYLAAESRSEKQFEGLYRKWIWKMIGKDEE